MRPNVAPVSAAVWGKGGRGADTFLVVHMVYGGIYGTTYISSPSGANAGIYNPSGHAMDGACCRSDIARRGESVKGREV